MQFLSGLILGAVLGAAGMFIFKPLADAGLKSLFRKNNATGPDKK